MHIEHNQFLKLVSEACKMDLENTEKQLLQLVDEINQSLIDGEAYEIEGFGIFSSIGNTLMFIPSNELETEINYKYVGMEPIELGIPEPTVEDPFNEVEDNSITTSFDGLIEEDIIDPILVSSENLESELSVEQDEEDEYAERLFASLKGEDYEAPLEEADGIDTSKGKTDDLGDIFADPFEENNDDDLGEEIASIMEDITVEEEEPSLNNEQVNFDTIKDGPNEESSIEHLDQLLDKEDSYEDLSDINTLDDDPFEHNHAEENIIGIEDPKIEKEDTSEFDDPFLSIQDEPFHESPDQLEDTINDDVFPVIRNTHTDDANMDQSKAKENDKQQNKKRELVNTSNRKRKELKKKQVSVWFWLCTILILSSGLIFGLTFFNVINVPFISFEKNNSDALILDRTPKLPPIDENKVSENITMSSNNGEIEAEQVTEPVVQENESNVSASLTRSRYGLMGELAESGNDGYTIVLYTLRNQNNATNEVQKLVNAGYRAFQTPITNERIGIMHRVSLGQFRSLVEAAIVAEEIENLLPQNYIIQKIN